MVCLRNICINTLHKGDNDDHDDDNNNNNNNNNNNTQTEVTANRPDIINENKIENMHSDRCGSTRGQKRNAKGSGKD